MKVLSLLIVLFFVSPYAMAHSGNTNQQGCHVNYGTGVYHCHQPKTQNQYRENWCIKQDYRTVGCGYSSYNSCASAAASVDYGYCVRGN